MKTIKLLFTAILMMMAMCVQAQTVQVMKDGQVVKEYPAAEVASVEFKTVYYYYAGWECPMNEEELASRGTVIENYEKLTSGTVVYDYITNNKVNSSNSIYYLVIPNDSKLTIIDSLGDEAWYIFDEYQDISIDGYKLYVAKVSSRRINGFILKIK